MNFEWREGNSLRLLENGEEFFPRVFGAIQRAPLDGWEKAR